MTRISSFLTHLRQALYELFKTRRQKLNELRGERIRLMAAIKTAEDGHRERKALRNRLAAVTLELMALETGSGGKWPHTSSRTYPERGGDTC